mmetsp:Transcript_6656/g.11630  ORF Transcript_6656/g.11630 Transcript_6656/m.11630 type:complete len:733 (+) Transcript_6656:87-2285(+)
MAPVQQAPDSTRAQSAAPTEKAPQQAKEVLATASGALRQEGKQFGTTPKGGAPASRGVHKQVCQVCRLEPMLFHECPHCYSRYCASGCLQSWYDHSKPSRHAAFNAPVVVSEGGRQVTVRKPLELAGASEQVDLELTQLAGGHVMAKTADKEGKEGKRWSILSVDGWQLGTPGPGKDWKPSSGVKLQLEELGACRSCKTQLAVQEYICNSASRRPPSAHSRDRKTRNVRTSEVGTQTDQLETQNSSVQATTMISESGTQAVATGGTRVLQAHVAHAGAALAKLAEPSSTSDQLVFLSQLDATREHLREALCALAEGAVAASDAVKLPVDAKTISEDDVVFKLKKLEDAVSNQSKNTTLQPQDVDKYRSSDRVLGHRGASFDHKAGSDMQPGVDSWGARILANGSLAALQRVRQNRLTVSNSRDGGGAAPYDPPVAMLPTDKDAEDAEQVFTQCGKGGKAEAPTQSDLLANINDAIVNTASLLCMKDGGSSVAAPDVVAAVASAAALLPSTGSNSLPWRRLAQAERWPWLARGKSVQPHGWQLLRSALQALATLAQVAGLPSEGTDLCSALAASLEAVAGLVLLSDAIVAEGEAESIPRPAGMPPPAPPQVTESTPATATTNATPAAPAAPVTLTAPQTKELITLTPMEQQPPKSGFSSLLSEVSFEKKPEPPPSGGIGDILGSGLDAGSDKPLFGGGGGAVEKPLFGSKGGSAAPPSMGGGMEKPVFGKKKR